MSGPHASPAALRARRLTTLAASTLVALAGGTNYVYSAYAPQLGTRLKINHTRLNVIGLAGNMGVYFTGPVWGRMVDRKGPRVPLMIASLTLLIGYMGMRGVYNDGLPTTQSASGTAIPGALSMPRVLVLVFCSFLTGVGGNGGLTSAVNSTAKSFPDRTRASATGVVLSGFGLSAFFFSTVAHAALPADTSSFLLLLALGTSLPMIVGFFFVRPAPPPPEPDGAVEHGHGHGHAHGRHASDVGVLVAADVSPFRRADDSQTRLLAGGEVGSGEAEDEDEIGAEAQARPRSESPVGSVYGRDSVELIPSSSPERSPMHRGRAPPRVWANGGAGPNISRAKDFVAAGALADISGLALFRTPDFWLLFATMSLLSGTGLMYINNVGSISQALFAQSNAEYDEVVAAQWQAAQVSAISVTNCAGRILIGILADFTKNRLHGRRVYCLPLVSALFLLSQIICFAVADVQHLWAASTLLGLAYGGMFGLMPMISLEWFGLAHFSENWGFVSLSPLIGGNLFSIAFGRNLDAHAPAAPPAPPAVAAPVVDAVARLLRRAGLPAEHQCLEGRACYDASLRMTIAATFVALVLSVYAGLRDRRKAAAAAEEVEEVLWEGGEL